MLVGKELAVAHSHEHLASGARTAAAEPQSTRRAPAQPRTAQRTWSGKTFLPPPRIIEIVAVLLEESTVTKFPSGVLKNILLLEPAWQAADGRVGYELQH